MKKHLMCIRIDNLFMIEWCEIKQKISKRQHFYYQSILIRNEQRNLLNGIGSIGKGICMHI